MHRPVTVTQHPGETMFVPGGWWHVVLNLDTTVAVTQNFCSSENFDAVWVKTRKSRPKMALKFREQLKVHEPRLYQRTVDLKDVTRVEGTFESSSSSSSASSSSTSSLSASSVCSAGRLVSRGREQHFDRCEPRSRSPRSLSPGPQRARRSLSRARQCSSPPGRRSLHDRSRQSFAAGGRSRSAERRSSDSREGRRTKLPGALA